MSLWKIAWRSIQHRALSSWLTGFSMALGVALVVVVLVIHSVINRSFNDAAQGYHLIVGAKGGKLQLVLNTVFHLSEPIENIPWSFYKEFIKYKNKDDKMVHGRHSLGVQLAVPYCLGDSYKDFRVVGTTSDLFDKMSYGNYWDGEQWRPKMYRFADGENFRHEDFRAAVIGSVAANRADLKLGDTFPITHGLAEDENSHVHREDLFHVVGILEPTGTPNDRAVFVNLEGFFSISGHAKPPPMEAEADQHSADTGDSKTASAETNIDDETEAGSNIAAEVDHTNGQTADADRGEGEKIGPHAQSLPDNQREVTAILVLMENDLYALRLENIISEGQTAQAVSPIKEVRLLFDGIVGPMQLILLILAILVIVVAGIGVMVSIYNSMSDRSREIAVMRALGAGRSTVMRVVLLESILLSLLGGVAGVLMGHISIGCLSPLIVSHTGISIGFFQYDLFEAVLIPSLILLAAAVGYLPAVAAYRTDVARALSAAP